MEQVLLSKAGEYASYGAMAGSVIPGLGNILGAGVGGAIGLGVGAFKGLTGRRNARREKSAYTQERNKKINKYNTEITADMLAANTRARTGEMEQKMYSGYDLGRNVVAKYGGMRYGHGGMNNQISQYETGGTPKKGEFGSGKEVYTDEEWANMSSADKNRAMGRIGGGRPGTYTGIKIPDPKWYSEQIISSYRKPDEEEMREGGMKYEHGGLSEVQMPMGQQEMQQTHQMPDGTMMPGATHGETMGLPQPMYKKGGMKMGMPRYGYAA